METTKTEFLLADKKCLVLISLKYRTAFGLGHNLMSRKYNLKLSNFKKAKYYSCA